MAASFLRLLALVSAMFFGSFLSGLLPLWVSMSEKTMQLTSVFGAGLIVGTALVVILPEGVETLIQSTTEGESGPAADQISDPPTLNGVSDATQRTPWTRLPPRDTINQSNNFKEAAAAGSSADSPAPRQSPQHEEHADVHHLIGPALLIGFLAMFLIEQAQIHMMPGHVHGGMLHGPDRERLGTASSLPLRADSPHDDYSTTPMNQLSPPPASYRVDPRAQLSHKAVAATIGMVIHSFSDGVAMGAASATSHSALQMVVFAAILMHKAPAAFGLATHLLHSGLLSRRRIKWHLLAFAAAAPSAALVTFLALSTAADNGVSGALISRWTGILLLFSAGSFLYVATIHVLPEILAERAHLTKAQVFAMVVGMVVPVVIQVDHGH